MGVYVRKRTETTGDRQMLWSKRRHQKTIFEAYRKDLRIQKERKVQSQVGNEGTNLWVSELRMQRLEGR